MNSTTKHVVIIGGGFAGLNAAKRLGNFKKVHVTLIDRRNHHLFQPLLYQVATAAVSPADIASPIRSVVRRYKNIDVRLGNAQDIDLKRKIVKTDFKDLSYDYLILACGANQSYFGHPEWEQNAPGLKSLEEATEIRRRVLLAYERAEREPDADLQKELLTFIVVGGGPTGVELAGALGEISRYTLSKDFRRVNPQRTRIFLLEGGPRILPSFDPELSEKAARSLESLGVTIWTNSLVTHIDDQGVQVGSERIKSRTVLWAAGVQPAGINQRLGVPLGPGGRVIVTPNLTIESYPEVFVLGDQANVAQENGQPLPGLAPVAIQQGRYAADSIKRIVSGKPPVSPFEYLDKGQMATIGKNFAVAESWGLKFSGTPAWLAWLVVHIFYLIGFRNKLVVIVQWAWSYMTLKRGARLITSRSWQRQAGTPSAGPKGRQKGAGKNLKPASGNHKAQSKGKNKTRAKSKSQTKTKTKAKRTAKAKSASK